MAYVGDKEASNVLFCCVRKMLLTPFRLVQAVEYPEQNVGLAREAVVDGAIGDPRRPGDVPDGGAVVTTFKNVVNRVVTGYGVAELRGSRSGSELASLYV